MLINFLSYIFRSRLSSSFETTTEGSRTNTKDDDDDDDDGEREKAFFREL